MRKLKNTVHEYKIQTVAFEELSVAQDASVGEWQQWILDWEAEWRSDNPYVLPHTGKISVMQIQQTSGDNTNYSSKYIEIQLDINARTYRNSVARTYGE